MAEYDSLVPYAKDVEHGTDATSYETLFTISFKKDDYEDVKIWAEIKRVGGSGSVYIRAKVSTETSTGVSTSNTTWTAVGPDTVDISGLADQVWDLEVQGYVGVGGAKMYCQGVYLQRYKA